MKLKKLMKAAVLPMCVMLALVQTPVLAQEPGEISVYVNGSVVDFGESKPIIRNSRTLAPARAVFGSTGAEVEWDANTKTVTVGLDGRTVKLKIGNKQVTYGTSEGSRIIAADAAPVIIDGSTYVPLGIIAESLGGTVEWSDGERAAYFTFKERAEAEPQEEAAEEAAEEIAEEAAEEVTKEAAEEATEVEAAAVEIVETPKQTEGLAVLSETQSPGVYEAQNIRFEMITSGMKFSMGDSTDTMETYLGKYNVSGESVYGYAWQEYNAGRDNYMMIGTLFGKIVALYSNSKKVSVAGITPGMTAQQLDTKLGVSLPLEKKSIIVTADGVLTIYRNSLENYSVIAVMAQNAAYTKPLTKITTNLFTESTERQLAGFINNGRLNRGLGAVDMDKSLSLAARKHSEAMAASSNLNGTGADGSTAFDRITASFSGNYQMASESIGRGAINAMEMYAEWMNDRNDSSNILDEHYNTIGVGTAPCPNNYKMYYTADFVEAVE